MNLVVEGDKYQRECEEFWRRENANLTPSTGRYQLTIGETPKFVWYRNAKVGTRSTLEFLSNAGVEFSTRQSFNCYYPPDLFKDYFKFAFVRNPWDRFVSAWVNKVLRGRRLGAEPARLEKLQDFGNFVDYCSEVDLNTCDIHIRRQSCLIDLNSIDYLGRFERFEHDLCEIGRILGLENGCGMPWNNSSKARRPWQEYYTHSLRDKVGEMYRKDIQIFSYNFEDSN